VGKKKKPKQNKYVPQRYFLTLLKYLLILLEKNYSAFLTHGILEMNWSIIWNLHQDACLFNALAMVIFPNLSLLFDLVCQELWAKRGNKRIILIVNA